MAYVGLCFFTLIFKLSVASQVLLDADNRVLLLLLWLDTQTVNSPVARRNFLDKSILMIKNDKNH